MCVWCPLWPIQRLLVEQPKLDGPIILFTESRRGLCVTTCSATALQAGVRTGMPLGEARALFPGTVTQVKSLRGARRNSPRPVFLQADPAADRSRLQRLALHCQRYSSLVGLEDVPQPESLWLDISGNEALFGGVQGLIKAVRADFAQQGIQTRVAIADTWGAAWAMCQFGPAAVAVVPPAEQSQALALLPVAALRLTDSIIESLQTLDVSTIGRLMQLPRTALPSRFGKELLRRLDQALGTVPELLTAERLVEPLSVEWLFEEPVSDRQTLEHVLDVLLDQILGQLNDRQISLRELHCHWLGATTDPTLLRLLRPTTDRRHLSELLRLQCERRVFTGGVTGLRLEVVEMGLPPVRQALLFENDADQAERHRRALAELVDRLDSRLGRLAVLRPRLRSDPQPEYGCEYISWLGNDGVAASETPPVHSHLRCRPLQLLRSPQPLMVAGTSTTGLPTRVKDFPIIRIAGPERIETGWWRGPDARRDYYRLDLANGAALWAFVDRETGRWCLHGLFV